MEPETITAIWQSGGIIIKHQETEMQERIGEFEAKLDDIKEDTTYIKKCIDGNGHKGLKI